MRSPSASRSSWFVALGLVALLVLALGSPAIGGPRLLTLKHAKKIFVTKKVARTHLTAAKGDARYLRLAGETRAPVDPGAWRVVGSDAGLLLTRQPFATTVSANGAPISNVDVFAAAPALTLVSGRTTTVVGLEVCYEFVATALDEAQLDRIVLQRASGTGAVPVGASLTNLYVDDTGRVDNACTTLRFAPVPLAPSDAVGIGVRFDFPDANTQVRVGRGSLILAR